MTKAVNELPVTESETKPVKVKRGKKKNPDSVPARPQGPSITSLSFDQVNDDADELIELRGEGRYFGVTDPTSGDSINALQNLGPLCANCHKRGHIRAKCKTVVCHKCGVVGEHYETHCPTTMICARCGQKGHMASACTSKLRKRQYCRDCDTFSHGDDTCPFIWRSYLTKASDSKSEESSVLPVVYCYNCGGDNHYGDECPETRTSRVPNFGSAYSGSNLPKELRPLYFHRLKSVTSTSRDYSSNSSLTSQTSTNKVYNFPRNPTRSGHIGGNNDRNSYSNNNSSYNNGSSYNNSYSSAYNTSSYNNSSYSNSNYNNSYKPSKPSYNSNPNSSSSYRSASKPERSGYIPPKPTSRKPTRTGMIEQSKKKQKKNIRNLY